MCESALILHHGGFLVLLESFTESLQSKTVTTFPFLVKEVAGFPFWRF